MKIFKNLDFLFLFLIIIIGSFGLAMIWSLVPNLFVQQLVFFLVGLGLFLFISNLDIRIFQNLTPILYLFGLGFLLLTFILGEVTRGSIRWIPIGNFTIQPSELVKPLMILVLASVVSRWSELKLNNLIIIGILTGIPLLLIFKQPDLGSSLVIAAIMMGILVGGGISRLQIIGSGIGLILFIPLSWFFLHDYQKTRILSFLNPSSDPLGTGYNLIQSMLTIGSGQFFGRGLGLGTQSHLAFLPERHTDFMFASLSEEFGLLGAGALILFYFLLLYRILRQAQRSSSKFSSLICLGVFSMLGFQVFINIGMNLGIMPITGIPLPLISQGGSSTLATMISLGLVQAAVKSEGIQDVIEIK